MGSVENGASVMEDWGLVDKTKDADSERIVSHLIDLACNTQNASNINIGRYFLQKSPKEWLMKRLRRQINSFLDNVDYWNYLRALELLSTIDKTLTEEIATRAVQHKDIEIQKLGRDFLN
jgi:hypothetical protein